MVKSDGTLSHSETLTFFVIKHNPGIANTKLKELVTEFNESSVRNAVETLIRIGLIAKIPKWGDLRTYYLIETPQIVGYDDCENEKCRKNTLSP
jgi:hypothetical protein